MGVRGVFPSIFLFYAPYGKVKTIAMSLLQTTRQPHVPETPHTAKHVWWRSLLLFLLLLLSVVLYSLLIKVTPPPRAPTALFTEVWIINILPYLAACVLVLATKPQVGRWYWLELGLIF